MTNNRRKSDVELAVLMTKDDALAENVIRHMNEEEVERKEIWKELRKLDKRMIYIAMPLLTAASGGGVAEVIKILGF